MARFRNPDAWQASLVHKIGSAWLFVAYSTLIASALVWFVTPSASVGKLLDPFWSGLWSATYGSMAAVALVARIIGGCQSRRARDTSLAYKIEGVACIVAAGVIWVWGLIIMGGNLENHNYDGFQAALALWFSSAHLIGWGLVEIAWVSRSQSERDAILHSLAENLAAIYMKREAKE